ncbi:sensor domain-containing diguanylate cyclase [Massilia glaciei]|uniref:diguanylate cyclase n=1 Tax=Massilia glaciei TaxID=1524097 RepID=A0A2U2HH37_9BURK|nr:GGDEF domain-containing protein [Massilia glaciei]PWF44995.1 diguanylate cyclase AdrA [Massilia glaciei]
MRSLFPLAGKALRPHWIVQTNYHLRTLSFLMVFLSMALDRYGKGAGAAFWTLLFLQFVVYPHLLYIIACRARDSQKAELNNLLLDSMLIGAWIVGLGFALWPSFVLFLATSLNITINRGWLGMRDGSLALLCGMLLSVSIGGFRFTPDTGWPATLLLMLSLSAYLIAIGNASNARNLQLRTTRESLRLGEQALIANNEMLQQQLAEIKALQDQLKEQALHDPMTGLFNRRYLDTIVPHELARCERDQIPLCLMMLDIDYFKKVNDTYGHQGGDAVLKELAALLMASIRSSDVACRYGGEEFLLLLPNMSVANALLRGEQLRAEFAGKTVRFGAANINATLSIGIACFPGDGRSPDELIGCADLALYRAKAEGRNRVVAADVEAAPELAAGAGMGI